MTFQQQQQNAPHAPSVIALRLVAIAAVTVIVAATVVVLVVARAPRQQPDAASAVEVQGTVKWFDEAKGFGFVANNAGGKDVFVHISTLGAAGLRYLAEGQAVTMRVVDTPKGREALSISAG